LTGVTCIIPLTTSICPINPQPKKQAKVIHPPVCTVPRDAIKINPADITPSIIAEK